MENEQINFLFDSSVPLQDIPGEGQETVDLAGYQVTKSEFFSHSKEPAITVWQIKYIQILIHPEKRRLIILPCDSDTPGGVCLDGISLPMSSLDSWVSSSSLLVCLDDCENNSICSKRWSSTNASFAYQNRHFFKNGNYDINQSAISTTLIPSYWYSSCRVRAITIFG